jgi:hypothetical protein
MALPTVKYIRKYADRKISLIYIERFIKGITVRFQQADHMVMRYFYRQNG